MTARERGPDGRVRGGGRGGGAQPGEEGGLGGGHAIENVKEDVVRRIGEHGGGATRCGAHRGCFGWRRMTAGGWGFIAANLAVNLGEHS